MSELLVPIRIDAMIVGKLPTSRDFQWTNLTPDFWRLNKTYLLGSAPDLFKLFSAAGSGFMPAGIHLHFRLPRAFSHGSQRGARDLEFPKIPNRWLVQRTIRDGQKLVYKAWLIKSDVEAEQPWSDAKPGVTWPVFQEGQPAVFKAIGRRIELTHPVPDLDANEPAMLNFTALGPGDPTFSAYYPACRSVLGFHDGAVPPGKSPSYLITGWYSTAADDPVHEFVELANSLAIARDIPASPDEPLLEIARNFRLAEGVPTGAALNAEQQSRLRLELKDAWLKGRNWECKALDGGSPLPTRLVCHGLVRGVDAQNPNLDHSYLNEEVFPSLPDKHRDGYRIAVGESSGEALAALCKDGEVDQDLFVALQADLLAQDVTITDLRYQLHRGRFAGVPGGTVFFIQPEADEARTIKAGRGRSGADSGLPPPPRAEAAILPELLRTKLHVLNEAQVVFDHHLGRVDDCIRQLYACWYLWTDERKAGGKNVALRKAQYDSFATLLDSEKIALKTAKTVRDDAEAAANTELMNYPKIARDGAAQKNDQGDTEFLYRLTRSVLPQFLEPNDPIIAIDGPAMEAQKTWRQTGPLPCRLSEEVETQFELHPAGGRPVARTAIDLANAVLVNALDVGRVHADLLRESLLLDPRNVALIAPDVGPLRQEAERLQAARATDTAYDWDGNPWIPLFLVWEVSWQSDYSSDKDDAIAPDSIEKRWTIRRNKYTDSDPGDGEPEFALKEPPAPDDREPNPPRFQGRSLLTPGVLKALADKLEKLDRDEGGWGNQIASMKNLRVMTQSLDGFHEALTQRRPVTQLPPLTLNPREPTLLLDPIREKLNPGIDPGGSGSNYRTAPAPAGPFLPIRAGRMQILQLSVVDAFGQTVKLPMGQINNHCDAMLRRAHNTIIPVAPPSRSRSPATQYPVTAPPGSLIALRPRFTRAMRCRFHLEDAGTGGGPVCGWLLPNHMEHSLAIYTAAGKPLGAFQRKLNPRPGQAGFHWVPFPGAGNDWSAAVAGAHLNHFYEWLRGLGADQSGVFSTMLDKSIESTDQRVPDQDPGVSVLVGRPLALVRASLRFEMPGLPTHSPLLNNAPSPKTVEEVIVTRGLDKVRWPVRLGDIRARNDGLVGAFACNASGATGGPLYPAWGQDTGNQLREEWKETFATQDFVLDCVAPLHLTLLMDPQAQVHATTGVVPRVSVELPPEVASGAKRARDVFFQTAPVLGESETPQMPRPSDDYGEWSWAYRPDVTTWKEDPNLIEAADKGTFSGIWPAIAEGWLKLRIAPVRVLSLWVREGTQQLRPDAKIHLAWSLQGAEAIELQSVSNDGKVSQTIRKWPSPPFPREYGVTVASTTIYRLTATARDAAPSWKDITIVIDKS